MHDLSFGAIFMMAVFSSNMIFSRFLGLCPFFGMSKNLSDAIGMGLAVIVVQTLTVLITWPLYYWILIPLELQILKTMMFILVIASCVQILEVVIKKIFPKLFQALGIFLPLITTNCIILGIALIVITEEMTCGIALCYAFCASFGFMLALVLMAFARKGVENLPIPKSFQGAPVAFFIASGMSLLFMICSGYSF